MKYRILPSHLHSTADGVARFFRSRWGVSKFKAEEPLVRDIGYVPTISAITKDFHHLCIEVTERVYTNALDSFVLECKNKSLPVKLYVAIPKGALDPDFKKNLQRAQQNGVGVLEFDNANTHVFHEAVSQSLTGLRRVSENNFPKKYRQGVSDAAATFLNGNPAKGCSAIYDEIEALTRRLAIETKSRGWWRNKSNGRPSSINLNTGSWSRVFDDMTECLQLSRCNCPLLRSALLSQVAGVIPQRNTTGHKPKNPDELKQRDSRLRTWFETAVDIFSDLLQATRPLRL